MKMMLRIADLSHQMLVKFVGTNENIINCNNISHKIGCKEGRRSRNVPPVSCIFPHYSP